MKLISGLKQAIFKFDLLSSGTLLRVKGEPQFQTVLGGLISISLMMLLAAAFYNKIIDTFNRVLITSSLTTTNNEDPASFSFDTIGKGDFMFGVEVWQHDLNTGKRYFDVTFTNIVNDFGAPSENKSISYTLEPCRRDHWDGYPQIQKDYDVLQMNYWLCLPKNMSFQIKGKYASEQSKILEIAVSKCTNDSLNPRPCATDQERDQLFIEFEGAMYFTIYFINPTINPQSQKYLTKHLDDNNYIVFSALGGEDSRLFIEDYEIQTDQSILPYTDSTVETGGIVSSSPLKSTFTQIVDTYGIFYFYKSSILRKYNRTFQKLDDVFSYIGGLFGTILIIFFLVSSYNTYKFEINISGYLFTTESKEQKLERNYNFAYFLGQLFYGMLKTFNCSPNWERLKYYYETREEALKQLDVLLLFKRVNFLEKSLSLLFTESQLKGLHLASHTTITEAVGIRRNYKLKPRLKDQIQGVRKKKDDKIFYEQKEHFDKFDSNVSCEVFKDPRQLKPEKQRIQTNQPQSDHFRSDCYSSESSSSDQGQQNVLGPILELKKESQKNVISKKIWKNVDSRLKNLIKPIELKKYQGQQQQTAKEEIQQHKIANEQGQNNPNLFVFLDNNLQEINQESQNESNYIFAKQTFSKIKPVHRSSLQMHNRQKQMQIF